MSQPSPDAALQRAVHLHQSGQLDHAESAYRNLLAASPDNPHLLQLLGMLLFQKGRRTEGLQHLRRAVHLNPADPAYHLNFGSALAQAGFTQEAIAETRKALDLAPGDAQAHFNLAHLLENDPERQSLQETGARRFEAFPMPEFLARVLGPPKPTTADKTGRENEIIRS